MAISSQELQFLDFSGVGEEECQLLQCLIDGINPAVEVLAPEPTSDLKKSWLSECEISPDSYSPEIEPADNLDKNGEDNDLPVDVDANQTIFYPAEDEYTDVANKSEAEIPEVSSDATAAQTAPIMPETEAAIIPEAVAPITPEVQYPSHMTPNGPPPTHPPDVGRPVFSPRPHMVPHPPTNMYPMPPPGHTAPPMYAPQGPQPSPAVPTVYVAQCHVNVGGFGNGQPQGGAMMPNHHPQAHQQFAPYMHMPEQQAQHIHMKNMHDKSDYDHSHSRQYQGNGYRGGYNRDKSRGRGRGGKSRKREEHERSNSVSSDHSTYSDGGKHYKDSSMNVPSHYPGHMPPGQIPYSVQYSVGMQGQYMVHQNNMAARSAQGHHLMYTQHPSQAHQFMPGPYNQQSPMLAYPSHPPPMPHMADPTHPSVMHQPLNYSQGSPMMPHQSLPPHPVYMGQTPGDIVVSLAHDPMMDTHNGINHSMPVDNVEAPVQTDIPMQMHESPSNVIPPSSVYVEPIVSDNYSTNQNTSTKVDVKTVTTTQNSTHTSSTTQPIVTVSPIKSSVTVTDVAPKANPLPTAIAPETDAKEKTQKPVIMPNGTKESKTSNITPPEKPISSSTNNIKSSSTPTNDAPVLPNISKPKESCPDINALISDTSSKIQITDFSPDNYSNIGEISFIGDSNSSSMEDIPIETKSEKIIEYKPAHDTPSFKNQSQVASSPDIQTNVAESSKEPITIEINNLKPKNVEEVPEVAISPPGGAWANNKNWSKLFKPPNKRVAYVAPFVTNDHESNDISPTNIENGTSPGLSDQPVAEADIDKAKIGVMLKNFAQNYNAIPLQPRGLINKGYWCYVNAPLQALLACPPFYNLCSSIPNIAGLKKGKSSTPVTDSMVEFVNEFSPVSNMLKMNKKEKSSAQALRKEPDIMPGQAFEPSYVYKMLSEFNGEQFKEGRQQDAEEMLSCVLNGLHDEMVSALKLAGVGNGPEQMNGTMNGDGPGRTTPDIEEEAEESDPDEWQVIGPRKKSCVTRTAHFAPSPISEIFWGQLRFVQQKGGGTTTANLQPFTTLPLDIQANKVECVRDALEQLVNREEISYTCSQTKEEQTVSKQVLLENLPQVLILQLKRFIYNQDGGLQKVTKRISFSIDLEITKELLSPNSRSKFINNQRKYKLLGVVYHDGKEATKGHYVADIYHSGYNCWLHYDDSVVKPVSESIVLKHAPPRVPYLLFYRRVDTMSGPSAKQKT